MKRLFAALAGLTALALTPAFAAGQSGYSGPPAIPQSALGQPNGPASLGSGGTVPSAQIPFGTTSGTVASGADACSISGATNCSNSLTAVLNGVPRTFAAYWADKLSVKEFGAIGDGNSHPLSGVTSFNGVNSTGWTLAQWQVFFPAAQALTDELDWNALQKAINVAAVPNGPAIYAPAGRYVLNRRLTAGDYFRFEGAGWKDQRAPGSASYGTILFFNYQASADAYGLYLAGNAPEVSDVEFETVQPTPASGWTPYTSPWAIYAYRAPYAATGANNYYLRNIMLRNFSNGIKSFGASGGRMDGIYGQCFNQCVYIDGNYDASHFDNLHFNWTFWSGQTDVMNYTSANAVIFTFGRVDGPIMHNAFAFSEKTFAQFFASTDSNPGGTTQRGLFDNIYIDNALQGFVVSDNASFQVSNASMYGYNGSNGRFFWDQTVRGNAYIGSRIAFSNVDLTAIAWDPFRMEVPGFYQFSNVHIRGYNAPAVASFAAFNVASAAARVLIDNIDIEPGAPNGGAIITQVAGAQVQGCYTYGPTTAATPSGTDVPIGPSYRNCLNATATVTAAGTTQATAATLNAEISAVTTVASGSGIILRANLGQHQEVFNRDPTNALLVYPPSGAKIEAQAANAGYSLAAGGHATFECVSTTQCYMAP